MIVKLKIKKVRNGDFEGSGGEPVVYRWVKGERADGLSIEFGTKKTDFEVDQEVEVDLEKTERAGGKFSYKQILEEGEY